MFKETYALEKQENIFHLSINQNQCMQDIVMNIRLFFVLFPELQLFLNMDGNSEKSMENK